MKKNIYLLLLIFMTGCANFTTKKEEVSKEKVKDIEDALLLSVENFDRRIKKLEDNQSEIFNILNKNTDEISEAITTLNEYISKERNFSNEIRKIQIEITTLKEDIKSLNNRISEVKGKIDEVIVATEEKNKKVEEELNKKFVDVEKEISIIKKNYTDMLSLPLTFQKSMNEFQNSFTKILNDFQNNLLELKDSQVKLANIIEETTKQIKDLKTKLEILENSSKIQNKTMIDELTRHESEIYSIKREIFYINKDLKDISDKTFTKNDELFEDVTTLKKTYNDLLSSTSVLLKSLTSFQDEILNFKNNISKINQNIENLNKEVFDLKREIDLTKNTVNENNKIIIDEFARHESEIMKLKESILSDTQISTKTISEKISFFKKDENQKIYVVQKGDCLSKIAEKFKVSISELKRINNLKKDIVYPGQKLIIPVKINPIE
ncbi:MAG: LysM peptidoglycan-binding domain-containing protein [Candidatus Ratteibacteria bacterium]